METDKNDVIKKVELRSERVRNIIGEVPPFLIRSGIGSIAIVIILVALVCSFIPIYETCQGKIRLETIPSEQLEISSENGVFRHHPSLKSGLQVSPHDTIGCIKTDNNSTLWYTAQVSGRTLLNVRSGERILKGDRLFAITPLPINIYGVLVLPYKEREKIRAGQEVVIELDGFPASKFGTIRGNIDSVYPLKVHTDSIANDGLKVGVRLLEGTRTSFKRVIDYFPELQGKGKVILSKQSVLNKILLSMSYEK